MPIEKKASSSAVFPLLSVEQVVLHWLCVWFVFTCHQVVVVYVTAPALTLTSFYGKKLEDSPADSPTDSMGEDGDNLVSIVKRRRVMAAKAAQEKEKRDLERRLQYVGDVSAVCI